ncbi:toxin glutamine deamidase domain-containing protein [Streptomyces durbertensis]|uniref:toxin glutamine deamidase domain-containing protein n=1 Tax=Streptomyces durbertensis TaxID=2448886 RepID=UPI002B214FBF|nr:toxin glutamine deamidase domain-containing protein [Streptomyces durbertensis]
MRADMEGGPRGLERPHPYDQQRLENLIPRDPDGTPQRHPDPTQPWTQVQNDGGHTVPGRGNNCADCSRSFLESWYGNPQVSAPRTLDALPDGNYDITSPERRSNENIQEWAGTDYRYDGDRDTGYANIERELLDAGHGSASVIVVSWPNGAGHAFNAVNHNGRVVWVDSQTGQVSTNPIHPQAVGVWHLTLDADRNPVDPNAASQNNQQDNNTQNPSGPDPDTTDTPQPSPQDDASDSPEPNGDRSDTAQGHNEPSSADSTPPPPQEASPSTRNRGPVRPSSEPSEGGNGQDRSSSRALGGDTDSSQTQHHQDGYTSSEAGNKRSSAPHEQGDVGSHQTSRPSNGTTPGDPRTTRPDSPDAHSPMREFATERQQQLESSAALPASDGRSDSDSGRAINEGGGSEDRQGLVGIENRGVPGASDSDPRDSAGATGPVSADSPAPPHAGSSGKSETGTVDPGHPINEPHRKEEHHPRLGPAETSESTHNSMYPMESQQELRQTNPVRQVDMGHVYQQLSQWAEPPKPPATQSPLAEVLNSTVPKQVDGASPSITSLRRQDLIDKLPGFADMHPGEQGAAVAAMARLSHSFHAAHAVGVMPESRAYPYAPSDAEGAAGVDSEGNPLPKGATVQVSPSVDAHSNNQWPSSSRRDDDLKKMIKEAFGKAGVAGALRESGPHRPDFTGRNYAVVEVYNPMSGEVSFVVDSSFNSTAEVVGKHSEPHLLDYLDNLNAGRSDGDKYQPLSLFTDREPCGRGAGLADCSQTLRERIPGVDVFYATEYRKEAEMDPEQPGPKEARKALNDGAHAENMVALGRVWVKLKSIGGLLA